MEVLGHAPRLAAAIIHRTTATEDEANALVLWFQEMVVIGLEDEDEAEQARMAQAEQGET